MFVLLDLDPFLLNFLHFLVVLFSDDPLPFLESVSELGRVLDFLTTDEHLRVHSLDLGLKQLLCFLFLQELATPLLQSMDGRVLVLQSPLFLVFQLKYLLGAGAGANIVTLL